MLDKIDERGLAWDVQGSDKKKNTGVDLHTDIG